MAGELQTVANGSGRRRAISAQLIAATLAVALFGCGSPVVKSPLVDLVGRAPNRDCPLRGDASLLPPAESLFGAEQCFHVTVGPPEAKIAVAVFEPAGHVKPRGTILVIHGIFGRALLMTRTVYAMTDAGYRAVAVDLRGHGRSTGDWLGFGAQEARDLSQVIDALAAHELIAGKLGVYGISYGATTSIDLAGYDPRIAAVVAVAPFSNIREEVPHFGRVMVPGVGALIPESAYQSAIDEAGRLGGFDPDHSTAVEAIRQTRAPVLILHGTNDWIVPHYHGERLQQSGGDHVELVSMPGLGHSTIFLDPLCQVHQRARQWFDRWLTDDQNRQ